MPLYRALQEQLPGPLRRQVLHFETAIEDAVRAFAADLPHGALVLDAGAGEMRHARYFHEQRYIGIDLGIGDGAWDYGKLDAIADLGAVPFRNAAFDAALNVVTLEHLREPGAALAEIARVLKPGAPLLLVAPHEWEVHQAPHDFFRYTRHGLQYLLEQAGFTVRSLEPVGGYFRLMSRRLLNAVQFFPGVLTIPAAAVIAPVALAAPLLDGLDRERNFTLGYICIAEKRPNG